MMTRVLLLTLATASTFFACGAAAFALGANGWTTPSAYSGACPATIVLNGMVTGGRPGAVVLYVFSYVDPSRNSVTLPRQAGMLDASGALAVFNPVSFNTVQAGTSSVQLSAQSDGASAISTRTPFSVACTSSGGPPPPSGTSHGGSSAPSNAGATGLGPPPSGTWHGGASAPSNAGATVLAKIAAPTGLTYTNDPAECVRRMGGSGQFLTPLMCPQIVAAADRLMLIWNWTPCTDDPNCVRQISGYHIYHPFGASSGYIGHGLVTSNSPSSLQSPLATQDKQEALFTFLAGFKPRDCYVVTAFAGALESPPSGSFCLPGNLALGTKQMTVTPIQMRSSLAQNQWGNGVLATLENIVGSSNSQMYRQQLNALHVGYWHNRDKSITGDTAATVIWRGGILFDLTSSAGKAVNKATLRIHVNSSYLGFPPQPNYARSCAGYVGTGNRDWWQDTNWIDGDFFSDVGYSGPNISIDVTSQVRNWVQGRLRNNGFVFKGTDENLGAFTQDSCETLYDGVALDVEYF